MGPVTSETEGIILVDEAGRFVTANYVSGYLGMRIELGRTDDMTKAAVNPSYQVLREITFGVTRLPVRVTRRVELVTQELDFSLRAPTSTASGRSSGR
jgi:hypothetical protein